MIRALVVGLSYAFASTAIAAPWNLPITLSDATAHVSFEVDSTWHTVHGTTSGVSGRAWLEDVSDYRSVRAEINLPVAMFNTDNSKRDKRMREVMDEPEFENVTFELVGVRTICAPSELHIGETCPAEVDGSLTIRDVTKSVPLAVMVSRTAAGYEVTGHTVIPWLEYGIEDPSMLLAAVDETAIIEFSISLADEGADASRS